MGKTDDRPVRMTSAERAQKQRDEKLADVQEQIDSGRMTLRRMSPEEMARHAKRREELQAQRRNRAS